MPIRGKKNAPTTFKGNYKYVESFIKHYNQLLNFYNVTSERDKCQGIIEYCSQNVKDFIQINPHYITPNWEELEREILNAYDADRMNNRVRPKEFYEFVNRHTAGQITNLSQWKKYHREYVAKAGFLKQNNQLNNVEYEGYFWYGIPKHLRGILELRLQAREPSHDISFPWPMALVQKIAEAYFKRSKFSTQLSHLPSYGYDGEEEDSSGSDYDSDSDDSDDLEQYRKHKQKKKKKMKQKKMKSKSKPPTQIVVEEPSRKIVPPPEEREVEGLIQRLNTMSLDDPQYGTLYYQAVTRDKTGLVAQCIRVPEPSGTVKPSQPAFSRDPPPHQSRMNYGQQQTYPRGILPRQPGMPHNMQSSLKCHGCFETNHML